jgi:opacity protein-like surface antigen
VEVNLRYSEQVSNSPAGTCGCFALEGAAGDFYWNVMHIGAMHKAGLGVAADIGVAHTGNVNGDGYGLTLTTYSAGPRFVLPSARKLSPFAQALFGLAHGSGSQFPQGDSLVSSANSFGLNLGAGADYSLNKRISLRILQLDYLRTDLPNNSSNWQNNLRAGAGITLQFSR